MADPGIKNLHQLNSAMDEGPNRCVGFLSEAYFRSVHSSISGHTKLIYLATTSDLYAAMKGKKILSGLASGIVDVNTSLFTVFPADCISPRAF